MLDVSFRTRGLQTRLDSENMTIHSMLNLYFQLKILMYIRKKLGFVENILITLPVARGGSIPKSFKIKLFLTRAIVI